MPASAAKEDSLRMRVGSPLETTSWAAQMTPTPVSARSSDPTSLAISSIWPSITASSRPSAEGWLLVTDSVRAEAASWLELRLGWILSSTEVRPSQWNPRKREKNVASEVVTP